MQVDKIEINEQNNEKFLYVFSVWYTPKVAVFKINAMLDKRRRARTLKYMDKIFKELDFSNYYELASFVLLNYHLYSFLKNKPQSIYLRSKNDFYTPMTNPAKVYKYADRFIAQLQHMKNIQHDFVQYVLNKSINNATNDAATLMKEIYNV